MHQGQFGDDPEVDLITARNKTCGSSPTSNSPRRIRLGPSRKKASQAKPAGIPDFLIFVLAGML
jgi:hypothetical protein